MDLISSLTGLSQGLSSGGAQSPVQTSKSGDLVDYGGGIVVSPTATNLGEILKLFTDGGPEQGGYGVNTTSRMAASVGNSTPQSQYNSTGGIVSTLMNPFVLLGGAAVILALIALK